MIVEQLNTRGTRRRARPPGIQVRLWRPGDTDSINRLYNDPTIRPAAGGRGSSPRTTGQWEWEFLAPNRLGPSYAVCVRAGEIIGTQAYIPVEVLCDGKLVLSGKSEDTLIHPGFRGIGLLDEMYALLFSRAREEGLAMMWGFTTTAVRPLLRNAFRSIGRFDSMQARLDGADGRARPSSRKTGSGEAVLGRRWDSKERGQAGGRLDGISIREMTEPDEQCDGFSSELARRVPGIMVHLSVRYLRWRLYDNPFRPYKVYAAYEDGKLIGLGVFKLENEGKIGFVSELAALPVGRWAATDVLDGLLCRGLDLFRSWGCRVAEARPSGPHPFSKVVRGLLARHGFEATPEEQAAEFLVRPIGEAGTASLDMERWRISEIMREY